MHSRSSVSYTRPTENKRISASGALPLEKRLEHALSLEPWAWGSWSQALSLELESWARSSNLEPWSWSLDLGARVFGPCALSSRARALRLSTSLEPWSSSLEPGVRASSHEPPAMHWALIWSVAPRARSLSLAWRLFLFLKGTSKGSLNPSLKLQQVPVMLQKAPIRLQ